MKLSTVVTALQNAVFQKRSACSNSAHNSAAQSSTSNNSASYSSTVHGSTAHSSAINRRSKLGASTPFLRILSVLTFMALPVAYVHAANTANTVENAAENTVESSSVKKTVTSKEYRYNEPYVEAEQAAVNENSKQEKGKGAPPTPTKANTDSLPAQPSENDRDAEASAVSTGSVLNTAPSDSKQAARIQLHANAPKSTGDIIISSVNEFWIYDSWVRLQQDLDYDGYFSTFSVEFDADTIFIDAPVYAVLYLGQNGVYDAIHVSSEFFIYGEDSSDSFVIESTLVSGFPAYDYDILLELYDAQTEQLVAFSDGYDNAEFAFVPLESETNEYIVEETVVIVEEHGGTLNWAALLFIIASLSLRCVSVKHPLKK
ncbi:choice-of-anchor H family protein [Alteromonas sp. BMJM2]|uniref:choice-of-anchor H family protein n=1 Tax=Alteromonas sp. BMJM2 TaxID=2954241 RepID=UPI0022B34545|nr:choice-of-anchor H family protein [Alteromonas sp. BMJM2]